MTEQTDAVVETQAGIVEATNARGIKVGGRWWNFSQYVAVPRPAKGQCVALEARGRFIRRLVIQSQPEPAASGPCAAELAAIPELRRRQALRQALIVAAAGFLARRADATPADVLGAAERWETWVRQLPAP